MVHREIEAAQLTLVGCGYRGPVLVCPLPRLYKSSDQPTLLQRSGLDGWKAFQHDWEWCACRTSVFLIFCLSLLAAVSGSHLLFSHQLLTIKEQMDFLLTSI
jgi:hypothetical protein